CAIALPTRVTRRNAWIRIGVSLGSSPLPSALGYRMRLPQRLRTGQRWHLPAVGSHRLHAMSAPEDLTRAHALYRDKRFAEADAACRQLLQAGPRTASAVHLLALVRKEMGDFAEGESLMRESIALDPGRVEYRANLGNLLRNRGRLPEAVEMYREA